MSAAGANGNGRCQIRVTDTGVRGLRDLTKDELSVLAKETLREYASRFPGGRDIPLPDDVKIVTTTDLAMAAYWNMRGVPVVAIRPTVDPNASRNQAAEFVHADYKGAADRLAALFISSEAGEYDAHVRSLKREAFRVRDHIKGGRQ